MASRDYKQIQVYPETFDRINSLVPVGVTRARFLHFIFMRLNKESLTEQYAEHIKSQSKEKED